MPRDEHYRTSVGDVLVHDQTGEQRIVERIWRGEDVLVDGEFYRRSAAEQCAQRGWRRSVDRKVE